MKSLLYYSRKLFQKVAEGQSTKKKKKDLFSSLSKTAEFEKVWDTFWSFYPTQKLYLQTFQKKIDYNFHNSVLLYEALTHRSAVNHVVKKINQQQQSAKMLTWNERLEFLGDSVLSLVISTSLFRKEKFDEGKMSKIRAYMVNESTLADLALKLELHKVLVVGPGEFKRGLQKHPSTLADALEAVIGAIYLDGGWKPAKEVVEKIYKKMMEGKIDLEQDHKTVLQEHVQNAYGETPNYVSLEATGPDHRKIFNVAVCWGGKEIARGQGHSKKKASQEAAKAALDALGAVSKGRNQLC